MPKQFYIKELSSLGLKEGYVVLAMSKIGKGTVFAVGDPGLYDEYADERKILSIFENYQAAKELVNCLLTQTQKN